jgi:type IV secretion system protein VirB1
MLPGLEQLVVQCAPNVAPSTMLAIVHVESHGNPLALSVNGKQRLVRQPSSNIEAISWAKWLLINGYSFDIGLTQVNSRQMRRLGLQPEAMFDPCKNLAAGARVLTEYYAAAIKKYGAGQTALRAAISADNSGNHTGGIANGYVNRVAVAAGNTAAPQARPSSPTLAMN